MPQKSIFVFNSLEILLCYYALIMNLEHFRSTVENRDERAVICRKGSKM
jgi:hypothetical protein